MPYFAYSAARSSSPSVAAGVPFSAARMRASNQASEPSGATLRKAVASFGGDLRMPASSASSAASGVLPWYRA